MMAALPPEATCYEMGAYGRSYTIARFRTIRAALSICRQCKLARNADARQALPSPGKAGSASHHSRNQRVRPASGKSSKAAFFCRFAEIGTATTTTTTDLGKPVDPNLVPASVAPPHAQLDKSV
jgi:hypothetical protein